MSTLISANVKRTAADICEGLGVASGDPAAEVVAELVQARVEAELEAALSAPGAAAVALAGGLDIDAATVQHDLATADYRAPTEAWQKGHSSKVDFEVAKTRLQEPLGEQRKDGAR
jgi:hypothetical protein